MCLVATVCPRAEQKWGGLRRELRRSWGEQQLEQEVPHGTARAAETPELHSSTGKAGANGDICL